MIDIIIPTYKNKQGLRNTLSSINQALLSNFTITIIDDCSDLIYKDIEIQFPFITILQLQQNVGPGMARQYGMQHTKQPYILFMDTGDLFYSDEIQFTMISTIKNNPAMNIFSWTQYDEMHKHIVNDKHNHLHGRIYKRAFLQQYGITFSRAGSYVNEDVGFNRTCRALLNPQQYFYSHQPLVIWTYNQHSITKQNNQQFIYNQQNYGLAYNEQQAIATMVVNNVPQWRIQRQADEIMVALYRYTYRTMQERPQFTENAIAGARYFYKNVYKKYEKTKSLYFQAAYSKLVKEWQKNKNKWLRDIPLNINRFLQELNN